MNDLFTLTRQLIDIESITPNEKAVAEFLEIRLQDLARRFNGRIDRLLSPHGVPPCGGGSRVENHAARNVTLLCITLSPQLGRMVACRLPRPPHTTGWMRSGPVTACTRPRLSTRSLSRR